MIAINTAFMNANLVLETKNGVFYKDIDAKSKHSENVLKTIDELCQQADQDILDFNVMSVVVGPGSFTGLRIGTAIAKALGCVNSSLKFVKVSSLELMAYTVCKNQLNNGKKFVCALNGLSDLYFVADFDAKGIKICEERIIDKVEFDAIECPIFALKGDLPNCDLNEIEFCGQDLYEFSKLKMAKNEFSDLEDMVPTYLRLSQAEDNLKKIEKKD